MASRTTDDYYQMALTGCVALTEPAFWAGWDRSTVEGVLDYFRQITEFEPKRAAAYKLQHYSWVGMNPKESEDRELSGQVLAQLPAWFARPTVIGVGEIGLNRVTRNEIATYTEQLELAAAHDQMVLIHTPHLEDKYKGTRVTLDVIGRTRGIEPGKVLVDHAEEHTVEMILASGCWAGLTLYPTTKLSAARALDIVERFGPDRILVAGACDWGPSDPVAVPKFVLEMRRRGHSEAFIEQVVYHNPVRFLSQSPHFGIRPAREATAAGAR